MPRLPRIHVDGSVYYVTSKGVENQRIFKEKADAKMYQDLLAKYKGQHGFKLYSYCLLSERLFLLVEPKLDSSISEVMHHLNSSYTKYFNAKYKRRGPLFESRFKSTFVEKSEHLGELTRHIHRAGLGAAEAASSLDAYTGTPNPDAPEISDETKEVMDSLGTDRAGYAKYVDSVSSDETAALEKRLGRGGMLGSEAFVENVKRRVKEASEARVAERPVPSRNRRLIVAIATVALVGIASSAYFYVSRENLKARYETAVKQMQESIPTQSPLATAPEGSAR